jgi:hypothetical protein
MTDNEAAAVSPELIGGIEGDVRIAIWNAGMLGGMGQNLTLAFIRRAMDEPTMKRALAALNSTRSPVPHDGEVERATILQNKRVNDAIQTALERGELVISDEGWLTALRASTKPTQEPG